MVAAVPALNLRGADDLLRLTIPEAAELLHRRKLSPVDLTSASLARIEKLNPLLNAFITVTAEQALSQARRLEAELRSRGPRSVLHGIPIALKDLIDTRGVRTTAGSALWADRIPAEDAEVVRRLEAAGAVLVGKCNMDEFAYNFTSETSHFGPIQNPWKAQFSPGGSSGGSAAAVASGMCFAALGSDTGGSIRLPAALCGITGMKPTYGRVSTDGVAPLSWSLDHVGPMCRSAREAAAILEVIGAGAPRAPVRRLRELRLGIPRKPYFARIHPEAEQAVLGALRVLASVTAGAEEIELPTLPAFEKWQDLPKSYAIIISAEAYTFHRGMLTKHPERYHPATRRSLDGGAAIPAADYIEARRDMDLLRGQSNRLFAEADILITPTAPAPAFELGKPASLVFLRNCAPWNLYGLPSISVPCGFSGEGLPVGLQLTGRAGSDALLLALASAYQAETDWHSRRPRL
jgi:aspartyl-tRNA(Asn)/glutamyl-tRNA(Gln) amidotransferase subunit A